MNTVNHHHVIKVIFGFIIFLFSLALAYFTADYFSVHSGADKWIINVFFIGIYLIVGMIVMNVYAISLGFLFAADVLLLDVLSSNFYRLDDLIKAVIIGVILAILYAIALSRFSQPIAVSSQAAPPPPPPPPPVLPASA
ncbi:MAG: hypothetical protein AAB871_03175 [Patescibacteria group bacterium]